MVAIAAHPSYTIKQLLGREPTTPIVERCPDFSDYMTYERYTAISTHLHFAQPPRVDGPNAMQGFWAIQPLLDAFNEHRQRVVIPGRKLCVDESMTKWRAALTVHVGIPVPCIVKMKAKPEPVGMMTKNIACVETGIMLRLEMVTSPAESARKQFNNNLPSPLPRSVSSAMTLVSFELSTFTKTISQHLKFQTTIPKCKVVLFTGISSSNKLKNVLPFLIELSLRP